MDIEENKQMGIIKQISPEFSLQAHIILLWTHIAKIQLPGKSLMLERRKEREEEDNHQQIGDVPNYSGRLERTGWKKIYEVAKI